ncbi:hypothetical protein OSH11_17365 [Kaistia dalseonensis]|uniref:CopG family transcriptional regulator n=1 Tax=Kaistia dalseonensis TaxID=410840 RepID=A0ABU0H9V1_9HYPH|nr:hypothetical protein [Kaistia dalseonensis]MCX5496479.1 hypothetical protein [Kaistia dalseonensis]MDQ0439101.1 hypothetical protein [Kaistia dalseonensis]
MADTPTLQLYLPEPLLAAINAFRREKLASESETDAITAILSDWLTAHGYFRNEDGTRPENLNAENDG